MINFRPTKKLQDYIITLYRKYGIDLPTMFGTNFQSKDVLWGQFIIRYVDGHGGGGSNKVDKSSFDSTDGYVVTEMKANVDTTAKSIEVVKTHTSVDGGVEKTYPFTIIAGANLNLVDSGTVDNPAVTLNAIDVNVDNKVDKSSFDSTNGYVVTELKATVDVNAKSIGVVKTHTSVDGGTEKTYPFTIVAGNTLRLTESGTTTDPEVTLDVATTITTPVTQPPTTGIDSWDVSCYQKINSIFEVSGKIDFNTSFVASDLTFNLPITLDSSIHRYFNASLYTNNSFEKTVVCELTGGTSTTLKIYTIPGGTELELILNYTCLL
jgi:hypothetical protein